MEERPFPVTQNSKLQENQTILSRSCGICHHFLVAGQAKTNRRCVCHNQLEMTEKIRILQEGSMLRQYSTSIWEEFVRSIHNGIYLFSLDIY